jgi:hypothetical protein
MEKLPRYIVTYHKSDYTLTNIKQVHRRNLDVGIGRPSRAVKVEGWGEIGLNKSLIYRHPFSGFFYLPVFILVAKNIVLT